MKPKTREEKGITLVGLIIIIAIIAVFIIIIRWAYGLSEIVNERTKRHQTIDFMDATSSGTVKY
jgi:Tfp pilus assembly protein PilE